MELTTDLLKEKFGEYNGLYFGGELKEPVFILIKSFKYMAMFSCTKKSLQKGRRICGAKIKISTYYDWDEGSLRDAIVHEMVHYYLATKHIDDTLSHGDAFQKMAETLNNEHGLNIVAENKDTKIGRSKSAPLFGWFLHRIFA